MEKGMVATPNSITTIHAAIVSINKVRYFKGNIASKMKFHCSIGHETVLASVTFFEPTASADGSGALTNEERGHIYIDALPVLEFDLAKEYLYKASLEEGDKVFALLEFEVPVLAMSRSLYIASKLDADISEFARVPFDSRCTIHRLPFLPAEKACRLAFYGNLLHVFPGKDYKTTALTVLKVFKWKARTGSVDRVGCER